MDHFNKRTFCKKYRRVIYLPMGLKSSKQKPVVEQAPLDVPSPPPPPEIKVVEPKAEIIKLVKETVRHSQKCHLICKET